jgi:Fe-S cluster assembly protein SufD
MSVLAENTLSFISNLPETSVNLDSNAVENAKNALQSLSLPTTRDEAWKYTRVAKIGKIDFKNTPGNVSSIDGLSIDTTKTSFVFVNGHFNSALSSKEIPAGVTIDLLSEASSVPSNLNTEGEIFHSINTAHLVDGLVINVSKNTVVEETIQVLHILDGSEQLSNFKVYLNAEAFSKVEVVEGFYSTNQTEKAFANVSSEINVGQNAFVTIEKMQYENDSCFHISTDYVRQDKDSTFTINTITLNGGLVRNNLNIEVNGENCTSNLNGAYVLKDKQHVDNHTVVDHKVPNCNSNELYKGVMDDKSTAVFNGKVYVRQDAQKINAFQSNRNVILSDDANVNSKPELEIYADDVKCSHGSTTGQLDEEAIYYLRARGLSKRSATELLVSAFITEVIDHIENESFRNHTYKLLQERFGWDVNPEDFG